MMAAPFSRLHLDPGRDLHHIFERAHPCSTFRQILAYTAGVAVERMPGHPVGVWGQATCQTSAEFVGEDKAMHLKQPPVVARYRPDLSRVLKSLGQSPKAC